MIKKIFIIFNLIVLVFMLSSCFSSRTELFTISLEEDLFYLKEEQLGESFDKKITYLSIKFIKTDEVVDVNDELEINLMGDYSYQDIKVFEVEFYLGLDNEEPIKYDLSFIGFANPGRGNAYAFSCEIKELKSSTIFRIVIELRSPIVSMELKIDNIIIQLYDPNKNISSYHILRTDLEHFRYESLQKIEEKRRSLERENYNQEEWEYLFNNYQEGWFSMHSAKDIDEISNILEEMLTLLAE